MQVMTEELYAQAHEAIICQGKNNQEDARRNELSLLRSILRQFTTFDFKEAQSKTAIPEQQLEIAL